MPAGRLGGAGSPPLPGRFHKDGWSQDINVESFVLAAFDK